MSFAAQAGVGLPGIFAINQTRRYRRAGDRVVTSLREPLSSSFSGTLQLRQENGELNGAVEGQVELAPTVGRFGESVILGKLVGKTADGADVNVFLGEGVRLGPVLRNSPERLVEGDIVQKEGENETRTGRVSGHIPRSFWNWFAIPLSDAEEQALHGELGKFHELALVFTMIAGLLNILAVWDAIDGPAYGYGRDSESSDENSADGKSASASREPTTVGAAS